jgi:hypothetical protein
MAIPRPPARIRNAAKLEFSSNLRSRKPGAGQIVSQDGRDGWRVNAKRVYRLYREMGLQLRHKTPKRRVKAKLQEDYGAGVAIYPIGRNLNARILL